MDSVTTLKKNCSNPRGCHTKDNPYISAHVIAEGVVHIGFACASRTMKEKDVSCFVDDSSSDSVKGRALIRIKGSNVLCNKISLLQYIIVPLLRNKRIQILKKGAPIPYNLWQGVSILKALPSLNENLINEIKAIILNLLL